ncbi:Rdx family-domain-containing protein [Aspergillus multicolor]|uniref:Rdx family-domain-containing protein n=1 Tax=Aspergillus multicolor TaxID=41759 RepID=UPI003CCDD83C
MTEPIAPIESNPPTTSFSTSYSKPRITVQYCTQCKWMLRAAYFAQELLSTFGTDIGEIALVPRTGGIFTVTIFPPTSVSSSSSTGSGAEVDEWSKEGKVLWDRKADGGFPEVKELKSRVRNLIDPSRDLGHTDRALRKGAPTNTNTNTNSPSTTTATTTTSTNTGMGFNSATVATDLPPPIPVPASASDPASMSARAKATESGSVPTSASDPASLSALAKCGEAASASRSPSEQGIEGTAPVAASMSARARVVGHADGSAGTGGATSTSGPGPASLSAREKIVDETAGGTVRKSDGEVCEDCM